MESENAAVSGWQRQVVALSLTRNASAKRGGSRMITGEGLIGKLALFIGEKLIGHKLMLSLDEKKRACRAFVELYYCLDRLEELNNRLVQSLGYREILIGDLQLITPAIDTVSNRFLEIGGELYFALHLIDPTLAKTVGQICASKGSFLHMLSNSIISDVPNTAAEIDYFEPDQRILSIDMDAFGQWVETASAASIFERDRLQWPQNLLWYGEFEEGFHPAKLVLNDSESLMRLRSILLQHGQHLSQARDSIRQLVAKNFTIEDVLYVSKDLDRDDF